MTSNTCVLGSRPLRALDADPHAGHKDHATYFPALVKLCDERKAANLERWRKYGDNKCGLSEAVIRGAIIPAGSTASTFVAGESEKSPALSGEETFVDASEPAPGDLEKAVQNVSLETSEAPVTAF